MADGTVLRFQATALSRTGTATSRALSRPGAYRITPDLPSIPLTTLTRSEAARSTDQLLQRQGRDASESIHAEVHVVADAEIVLEGDGSTGAVLPPSVSSNDRRSSDVTSMSMCSGAVREAVQSLLETVEPAEAQQQRIFPHIITILVGPTSSTTEPAADATEVASRVVHKASVREKFHDGVAWISLGGSSLSGRRRRRLTPIEYRDMLLTICSHVALTTYEDDIEHLTFELQSFAFECDDEDEDEDESTRRNDIGRLKALFAPFLVRKHVLVVLDDVTHREDLDMFFFGQAVYRVLATTTTSELDTLENIGAGLSSAFNFQVIHLDYLGSSDIFQDETDYEDDPSPSNGVLEARPVGGSLHQSNSAVIPYDVPAPPHAVLDLEELVSDIVSSLLKVPEDDDDGSSQPNEVVVVGGMGGIGKTTQANLVVRHNKILEAFCGGLAWVSLGTTKLSPIDYRDKLLTICSHVALTDARLAHAVQKSLEGFMFGSSQYSDLAKLKALFAPFIVEERILLVLDNVWHREDLELFCFCTIYQGSSTPPAYRILATTRLLDISAQNIIQLDVLRDFEALQLLEKVSGVAGLANDPDATDLVGLCGNIPLAIVSTGLLLRNEASDTSVSAHKLKDLVSRCRSRIKSDGKNFASSGSKCSSIFDFTFNMHGESSEVLRTCFAMVCYCFTNEKETRPRIPSVAVFSLITDIISGNGYLSNEQILTIREDSQLTAEHIIKTLLSLDFIEEVVDADSSTPMLRIHHDLQYDYGLKCAAEIEKRMCQRREKEVAAPRDTLKELRFRLGELLLLRLTANEIERHAFLIIFLLNEGIATSPLNDAKRTKFAELYLVAATKAMSSFAYEQASHYASVGTHLLLPTESSETSIPSLLFHEHTSNLELCINLVSTLAEALYYTGDRATAQKYCREMISSTEIPLLKKRRVYKTLLDSLNAQDRPFEAEALCLDLLGKLGCRFASGKRRRAFDTVAGVIKTKTTLKRTVQRISKQPVLVDETKVWVLASLDQLLGLCYHTQSDLLPIAVFRGMKYLAEWGVTDVAPSIVTSVGIIFAGVLGDLKGGMLYAKTALELLKKVDKAKRARAKTLFCDAWLLMHYQVPEEECKKLLLEAYEVGLLSGDIDHAAWAANGYLEMCFYTGKSLASLDEEFGMYARQVKGLGTDVVWLNMIMMHQAIRNIMGRDEGCHSILKGGVFDAERAEEDMKQPIAGTSKTNMNRLRIEVAFWAGDFSLVLQIASECRAHKGSFEKELIGVYSVVGPLNFYIGIAAFVRYSITKQKRHKKFAYHFAKKIKALSSQGDPNVIHFQHILDAEKALIKKRYAEATEHYESAAKRCQEMSCTNYGALTQERLGDCCLNRGLVVDAQNHYKAAIDLYDEW
eukprot:CAMPEP_0181064420 /NCGR_PEP_ID=MMETSP1070-20121207/24191_1 /TAXON_ID=265543 /ORGANISM="Minutocellus polymorphus, Strain NH13" /LENGTH=1381 /DNA_ID=CAMNT_0023144733 /DNA_START=25 /DNA_END=4167 /DNA_ORIENTATION=+